MSNGFYLLVDESGSMSEESRGSNKKLALSIIKISNEKEKALFEEFVNEYKNLLVRYCEYERLHLYCLYTMYGGIDPVKKELFDLIYKHASFLESNLLNLIIEVGYDDTNARNTFHTIDAYISSLYYLFHNATLFLDRNMPIFYSVEELRYLYIFRKFLDQYGYENPWCENLRKVLKEQSDVYKVSNKINRILGSFRVGSINNRDYLLVVDLAVSGFSFLKDKLNYIKLQKLSKPFVINENRAYNLDLSITGKYKNFDFKIPSLTMNITFNQNLSQSSQNINTHFYRWLNIENSRTPFKFNFDIVTDFDKSLVDNLVQGATNLDISLRNTNQFNSIKGLITTYIGDISILGKLDLINTDILSEYFGIKSLPQIDLSIKPSNKISIAQIMSLLLESFYKESYDPEKLSELDAYPLIKYVYMSNIAYKDPNNTDIHQQLSSLQDQIGDQIIRILNYDSIHQDLNRLYIEGRFEELSEKVKRYEEILLQRIKSAPLAYRRRYLNLFGKIFTEFYKLDIAEAIYRNILQDTQGAFVKEIYRTRGSLAEVLARKGDYQQAIMLYQENLSEDLVEEERIRTKSQMIYPLFFEYLKTNSEEIKESLEEFLIETVDYYDQRSSEIIYALLVESFLEFVNTQNMEKLYRGLYNIRSKLQDVKVKETDPLNLPIAIFEVMDGKVDNAINRLEKANFLFELADLLNSRFVEKQSYSKKLEDIQKILSKDVLHNIRRLLSNIGIDLSDRYQKQFLEYLFSKDKKELITYRMNILNLLP